jgi:RHS repeat-associated protein
MIWVEERDYYVDAFTGGGGEESMGEQPFPDGTLRMRVDYKYDWYGNRIEKTIDEDGDLDVDVTQRYAQDGWNPAKQGGVGTERFDVWADLNGSNSLTTRYVRGDDVDQLLARIESGGAAAWILTDHLGSIVGASDGDGVLRVTMAYDGFGNMSSTSLTGSPLPVGRYQWTGREFDSETEFQYNRARYYDPQIGRWLSEDPLGFDAGDSNLYRYVHNEYTGARDPSGLEIRIYWTDHLSSDRYHVALYVFDPTALQRWAAGLVGQAAGLAGQEGLMGYLARCPQHQPRKIAYVFEGSGPAERDNVKLLSVIAGYESLRVQKSDEYTGIRNGYRLTDYIGDNPSKGKFVKVDTGDLTFEEELAALKQVAAKLRQIPFYKATGPNSNTYTFQLLKLASELQPKIQVPQTLDNAPGWNYQGIATYDQPLERLIPWHNDPPEYDKWGEPIWANIALQYEAGGGPPPAWIQQKLAAPPIGK